MACIVRPGVKKRTPGVLAKRKIRGILDAQTRLLEGSTSKIMRRLSVLLLICLLPLAAVGQSVSGDNATSEYLLAQPPAQMTQVQPGVVVPLWRAADGRLLALKADSSTGAEALRGNVPLGFHVVDANTVMSTGLQYGLTPNLQLNTQVSQHTWTNNQASQVLDSEVGASYGAGRYSLGLSVGTVTIPDNNTPLPSFDSSQQLNARGRLALGSASGIDVGASVGHIYLLPGNLLGVNTLDQKALSFGVDHGPLSGTLIGRTMEPSSYVPGGVAGPDKRWNSIDLGVTWRLPWRGSLSVGAQNLWSSGSPTNTPAGPEPDQSRTPYVQYHQDL